MLPNHESIRSLFPFLKDCLYLDAAHFTPYSVRVSDKIKEYVEKFTNEYDNLSIFNIKISQKLKENAARLINAQPEDIIITSNTTHGINIFAYGLNLKADDNNVAVLNSEFPAVVYPWLNLEKQGRVNVFFIPSDKGYTNEIVIKKALLDNNIRVFTISYVQFLGYRYNIRSISDFCRKNNIYLAVDAIQATGICPIDVQQMGIDYLCTGNQKWLMSPAGTGFAFISKKYRAEISPTYIGTTSIEYDFANFLNYKLDFKSGGGAYENSTLNTLGMIGMNESITHFLELGVENIFSHITGLLDKFIDLYDKEKYKIESDISSQHRSNILIFTHVKQELNKQIVKQLSDEKVYIALREDYLRISPHIYNNEGDIEKLINLLNTF